MLKSLGIKIETKEVMQIVAHGRPHSQTRARHVQKGDRMVTYSNATKGIQNWKKNLKRVLRAAKADTDLQPLEGAVCVDIIFLMPLKDKKRHWQISFTKPDKDNLEKAILDVMESLDYFAKGDSQVGVGETIKLNVPYGYEGVMIKIAQVRAKKIPSSRREEDLKPDWLA